MATLLKLGGFYWSDAPEPSKFLIIYEHRHRRGNRSFVGVKCYGGTNEPIIDSEYQFVAWFDESGALMQSMLFADVDLRLVRKAAKSRKCHPVNPPK